MNLLNSPPHHLHGTHWRQWPPGEGVNLAASLWALGEGYHPAWLYFYFLQREDISSKWSQEACSRGWRRESLEQQAWGGGTGWLRAWGPHSPGGAARGPVDPAVSPGGCFDHWELLHRQKAGGWSQGRTDVTNREGGLAGKGSAPQVASTPWEAKEWVLFFFFFKWTWPSTKWKERRWHLMTLSWPPGQSLFCEVQVQLGCYM